MQKILAIDDKQDNLITLSALLRNLMPECAVITARSGPEGIAKAVSEAPDVVLLDVKMPEMDGFETCRRLRDDRRTGHIPTIMITAVKTDAASRIRGLACGANAFLSKPIDPSELVSQVRVALRIKKAEDDLRRERDGLEEKVRERTAALQQEIAERRRQEVHLEAANAKLEALWNVSALVRADIKQVADHILATVVKMTRSLYGFYGFVSDDESAMTIHAWSGEAMADCSMVDKSRQFPIDLAGLWGEAIRCRKPLILNDYAAPHRAKKGLPAGHVALTNLLVVPFFSQGRITALAAVANRDEDYGSDDVRQILAFLQSVQTITEGKQLEEALRESEERFRRVSSLISDIAYSFHADGGGEPAFTWLTGAVERISGYAIPEIRAHRCWRFLVVEEDLALFEKNVSGLSPGARGSCELRIRRRDGGIRWLASSAECTAGRKGTDRFLYGSLVDITERKNEDLEKRRAQEKASLFAAESAALAEIGRVIGSSLEIEAVYEPFAAVVRKLIPFDSLMVNLCRPDKNTLEVAYVAGVDVPCRCKGDLIPFQGSVTEAITHAKRGLLLQPENAEELIRQYPSMIQAYRAGLNSMIAVPLISADEVIGVLVFRSKERKAYSEKDLQLAERIGIQIAGAIASARLFSDLKRVEKSLRDSEERFRLAYATSPDAININRMQDGLYVDINEGFTQLTGFTREEAIGRTSREIDIWCNPADRQVLVRGLREKGYYSNLEAEFRRKDGSTTAALMSARMLDLGGVPHILSITRDIGDRKRMEEENRRLTERLQRAEKMEALGTLAGGVAHDLNNVLGIVVGYAGMLLDDAGEASPHRADLMNILSGGERAAAIVQDLLTLARRGVANRKVLNLTRLVVDWRNSPEFRTISSYHPSVQFRVEVEPNSLNLSGSAVHICKTLSNLVLNGCEAMPGGGVLTIRTSNRYIDRPIQGYDEVREGDYVVLSVSDTGEGIPEEDLQRIFEPFYTKKVMGRSGTGLGLAVVWGTVKDHCGYINVQSAAGQGSTFTLYFPVTREMAAEEQAAIPVAAYRGWGESVLVVDDVEGQRELAATMLRKLNYNVMTASGGEEAVTRLREHPADLLVLDMIMDPGIDGLETYRRILAVRPGQRAVIVSGFSESERVSAAQALGAGAYIKKPYVMETLGLAVRRELDRRGA